MLRYFLNVHLYAKMIFETASVCPVIFWAENVRNTIFALYGIASVTNGLDYRRNREGL